jgi:hypothetical protein
MLRRLGFLAVSALLAASAQAEVSLRPATSLPPNRIDVRANGESISEVLDRIARQTGMKVTYEGGTPRARITRQVSGVTPAQAVVGVLDGQGLSYFMELDRTSTQVQTLLVVNSGAARQTASAGRRQPSALPVPDEPEDDGDEAESEAPGEEASPEQTPQGPRQFRNGEGMNQVEPEREAAPNPGAPADQPAPAVPLSPISNLGGVPGAFTNYGPQPTPPPAPEEAPAPGTPRRRRPASPPGGVQ